MDEVPAPAYYAVTSENHAAWVVAVSIIFLIYSILGVVGKIMLRINLTYIKTPDICLIACLVALIVETSFVVSACRYGLGRHTSALDDVDFERVSKYYYAASILAIAIQATTKISICLLISAISPQFKLLVANRVLMALIVLWAFSGIFAVSFACGLPHPWRGNGESICDARKPIQLYNGVFNILSDLAICVIPIIMMWRVQTSKRKKLSVCALFGSRILVPASTIPFLTTSRAYYDHMQVDPTWYAVVPTILAQISVNLSVLTACIPGLKSLLENLLSGIALARVQNDYNLTSSGDRKSRLTMTPVPNGSANSRHSISDPGPESRPRSRNSLVRLAQRFRLDNAQHEASGSRDEQEIPSPKPNASRRRTENTTNPSDGTIVRTDQYEVTSVERVAEGGPHGFSRLSGRYHDEIQPA